MVPDTSIKAFYEYLRGAKAANTARKYASYAAIFVRLMQTNGYQNFEQIPPGLLSQFSSMLSREHKSPSTVRVHVYAVKKYLEWAKNSGVKVSEQARPELPKRDIRLRPTLPEDKFTLYFRQADMDLEEPIRTAVMLLPCCGLRASEMVGLRLADIERAFVTLQNGKKKPTLFLKALGKGNKQRAVPLMDEGVEILTGYLAGWRNEPRNKKGSGQWLFPKVSRNAESGNNHISDRYLRLALQRMREPLGMEFTPHTMRRTYITMLYRKKVDLRTLADIAGHANVQTTIDHYIVTNSFDSVNAVHEAGSSMTGR